MKDLNGKCARWFETLTDAQQHGALEVVDEVPDWMIESLIASDIAPVAAEMNGHKVFLMPSHVREFLRLRATESA
jgi:hypothetical protein